jgi:hypothetical protein
MEFPFGPSAIIDSFSPTAPVLDALKGLTGGAATSSAESGLTTGNVGGSSNFGPVNFGGQPALGSTMLSTQNLVLVGAMLLLGFIVYKKVK